jgi:hypothetical protein
MHASRSLLQFAGRQRQFRLPRMPVQASHGPHEDKQAHANPQRECVKQIEEAFVCRDVPVVPADR